VRWLIQIRLHCPRLRNLASSGVSLSVAAEKLKVSTRLGNSSIQFKSPVRLMSELRDEVTHSVEHWLGKIPSATLVLVLRSGSMFVRPDFLVIVCAYMLLANSDRLSKGILPAPLEVVDQEASDSATQGFLRVSHSDAIVVKGILEKPFAVTNYQNLGARPPLPD
jgi:hypothetical protein